MVEFLCSINLPFIQFLSPHSTCDSGIVVCFSSLAIVLCHYQATSHWQSNHRNNLRDLLQFDLQSS
jgi:hypothetical protein